MIIVSFSDFEVAEFDSIRDAEDAILEAHAESVGVEWIEDDEGNPYSCIWEVTLQKEAKE